MLPSLELAKQLSTHCHVTYLISANKIKELESKGFIPISNVNRTLDIVGLIDGNDDIPEFELQDSQIKLNNTTKLSLDNRQKLIFNNVINRMGTALNQLFHSNQSQFSLQPLTTQHISLPIDTIIIQPFTPLSLSQFSIPIHLFLPSNLDDNISNIILEIDKLLTSSTNGEPMTATKSSSTSDQDTSTSAIPKAFSCSACLLQSYRL
ncbi:unnamed protein product [Adineta steineri]|uniref:Uncharacterized protein n=1 Tax=Adineta steineri TaxID=433720 RepID=A0A813VXP8_9BILA|nr:unnamed protein product [Adineta steineri]CAF1489348.1 unnamed protein product [Adineta steineri]